MKILGVILALLGIIFFVLGAFSWGNAGVATGGFLAGIIGVICIFKG